MFYNYIPRKLVLIIVLLTMRKFEKDMLRVYVSCGYAATDRDYGYMEVFSNFFISRYVEKRYYYIWSQTAQTSKGCPNDILKTSRRRSMS